MTMHPAIARLRTINPVPHPPDDPEAAERLLRRLIAEPRPARRGSIARRRLVIAVPVVAAALLVSLPLALDSGGQSLAAKAYAATSPGDKILHEVVVSNWATDGGGPRGTERLEGWYRPADGRAHRVIGGDEGSTDLVVAGNGHVSVRSPDTERYGIQPPQSTEFTEKNRTDFLAEFRTAYARHELHAAGTGTFDGRTAARYTASEDGGNRTVDWYIDPDSALPLGSVERLRVLGDAPGGSLRTQTLTRRLTTFERLDATPENLAKLTG
jgi:hypothetical protein